MGGGSGGESGLMSIRRISKSFYRSGFRGWIRGPLTLLRPQPGKVTTKVTSPEVELIVMQPAVVAKTLTPVVTSAIIYSE